MEVLATDQVRITSRTVDGTQYSTRLLHLNASGEVGSILSVSQGQVIGTVENLNLRYPGITDHVHLELYTRPSGGNFSRTDPTPYFFP
jgi:murein DD-endopeptidase MepM/ murein hydrolase activator NlpD